MNSPLDARRSGLRALGMALTLLLVTALPAAAQRFITVASTTSTENSGLFGFMLPKFKAKTGIDVHVVAKGTGQAINIAQKGDCDVLFVHDTPSELKFMAAGWGLDRRQVMYNDFVVVGPASDPAGVAGGNDTEAAFNKIAGKKIPFVSRGDDSGTHKAELRFWKDAGIDVKKASGSWYREAGQGMGETLNTAAAMDGYSLTDRGTWLSFKNRQNLKIVVEGDPKLFNQYGIMLVNPAQHPHVKKEDGMAFINWLTSPDGQQVIADYKIDGKQLFFPNYKK
jgi:tungstate transport system substrate-binding protein